MRNIAAAFAGESQARNKYTFYAEEARKSGFDSVAILFEKMEENEKEHARVWFRLMKEGSPGDPEEHLEEAARNENYEWENMYYEFAKQAKEDGDVELAFLFDKVASIEKDHERQFLELLVEIKKGGDLLSEPDHVPFLLPTKESIQEKYYCILCGNVENESLERCPLCGGIGSFVDIL